MNNSFAAALRRHWRPILLVAAVLAFLAYFAFARKESPQYFTARVEKGDIHDVVEVTGTINAVTTVLVGSQVSGTIARLYADFNSLVHKGDVIARIEPSLLQGALLQATADLESAKANVLVTRANLERANAGLAQARADYKRAEALVQQGMVSHQSLDQAKANSDSAQAAENAAVAAVTQASAQVSQKQAAVSVANINVQNAVIRSPIDGTVVARNVDVGQTVAASLQAPTLFTIAQDLKKMQVYAKTDESDIGNIQVGRAASFKVDAFPKSVFQGKVSQVRMNPTTIQNVVTYDTIIDFDNPELRIFPGMTAYVTVPVADAQDVLRVPNGALRWKPQIGSEELQALYARFEVRPTDGDKPRRDRAIVWKLEGDQTVIPVEVALGITDHAFTAVKAIGKTTLKEGEQVITGAVAAKAASGAPGGSSASKK